MRPRPPRTTRTSTLYPYTPHSRSLVRAGQTSAHTAQISWMIRIEGGGLLNGLSTTLTNTINAALGLLNLVGITSTVNVLSPPLNIGIDVDVAKRSAERRVGKECVSTCRSRWSPYH